MIWDISPVIFEVGPFTIRWYGVFFAAAFLGGYFIVARIHIREGRSVAPLSTLMNYTIIGTLIGARLGHCLLYDPVYYLTHPLKIPAIWEGGLASHGGAAGMVLALWFHCRNQDLSFIRLLDRIAIAAALGGALIRVGNFFNSEIYGLVTDRPWAVVFARIDPFPRHPSQLYESLVCLVTFMVLVATYRMSKGHPRTGLLSGLFLTLIFSSRFFLEFLKVPQAAYTTGLGLNTGQWVSIPFVAVGGLLIARALERKQGPDIG